MKSLLFVLSVVFHVGQGGSINAALDSARQVYNERQTPCVIEIAPGTYYEELTIDIPHLTLRNAAKRPSIVLHKGGVEADRNAVRISWYYGHGYQYRSMGDTFNYGGKRMRCWNASVLVTAQDFTAENIIFENSFNQYVSPAEMTDSLWDISQTKNDWTVNERPKRQMPQRPRVVFSTEVQYKRYNERAAAISFASTASGRLVNCRCVGHQDVLYGDHGAAVDIEGGIIQGTVDFIFGGMDLTVRKTELVVGCNAEKKQCYIAAGRGYVPETPLGARSSSPAIIGARSSSPATGDSVATPYGNVPADELARQGMVFDRCVVRYATKEEAVSPGQPLVYLARPWRWWGRHVFVKTDTRKVRLHPDIFSLGLTKGKQAPFCSRE